MAKINVPRLLIGGLVAGLVVNIGELVLNGLVLADAWEDFWAALGLGPPGTAQWIIGAAITFAYGIVLIWFYVAMRPRFGPGPKTALIAGLTFWLIAYVLFTASILAAGLFTPRLAAVTIVWGLVESPLAALAGAFIYREDEDAA